MFASIIKQIFGSRNDRVVKRLTKTVHKINALEEQFSALSDRDFPKKTQEYRDRLKQGETLDDLLPEAFALVREAGKRVMSMRHFDVQLIGAMVLHNGNIAEMRTGEGKTLVATLAAYLNALPGKGVHVITVNDYLAKRDSEWMGKLYNFLGLSTDVIISGLDPAQRKAAYAADITYGTNNEFGFDYLRDNMAFSDEDRVQREKAFAIVDEVDSILIDEARTPLIISGAVDDRSDLYVSINTIIPKLSKQEVEDGPGDYSVEEKGKQALLTEEGNEKVEKLLVEAGIIEDTQSLYDPANITVLHHLNAALRAHSLFHKDVDYVVNNDEVMIVDEFTGRTMPGRRWSDGLHQAIEAKEGVSIQNENQTLATITYQNYFRLYDKLAGMTGTADTEAFEFQQIYGLEVIVIPTNLPMVRKDMSDMIFLKATDKFKAIIEDVKDCQSRGQPVLVGTASIEVSEYLSKLLEKEKIKHQVLNAKFHEKEADIIRDAGIPGTVTIATNMAGRGTDIVLGGNVESQIKDLGDDIDELTAQKMRNDWKEINKQVLENGGLHIIGTERHESRRIDNQLRGRAGRQGDAGSSRFYLSLEDSLMRIFASDWVSNMMGKLGMEDGEAIESNLVSKAIENAQRKVEGHNFDIRKQLLEFDDVANDQRKVVYEQRDELLTSNDVSENINAMHDDVINDMINAYIPLGSVDEVWEPQGLSDAIKSDLGLEMDIAKWVNDDKSLDDEKIREKIFTELNNIRKAKEESLPSEVMRRFEKQLMLNILDKYWKEHLIAMDHLRQGIHLRSYAQKNPKQEYKREAFEMFVMMLEGIKQEVISFLYKVQIRNENDVEAAEEKQQEAPKNIEYNSTSTDSTLEPTPSQGNKAAAKNTKPPFVRGEKKVGRNEPCPCGSGKKFKQCHGKI